MKTTIGLLALILVLTNAFWIFNLVDSSVSFTHQEQYVYELESTNNQLMKLVPSLAKNISKEDVILIANQQTIDKKAIFEKGGCTWVDWLGFKFNSNDQLQAISLAWSFDNNDICDDDLP